MPLHDNKLNSVLAVQCAQHSLQTARINTNTRFSCWCLQFCWQCCGKFSHFLDNADFDAPSGVLGVIAGVPHPVGEAGVEVVLPRLRQDLQRPPHRRQTSVHALHQEPGPLVSSATRGMRGQIKIF